MQTDDPWLGGPEPITFHGMVVGSAPMQRFVDLLKRVARSDASVLLRGETGTGKELAARALHDLSRRSGAAFRAINCATLTPDLLASELFGHVRGAFTGAVKERRGLFQLADGGTLFLDEVAEIPLDIQARLLRVLQERTFVPLGGADPVEVDVRVVAATHRALRREVEAGRFREDLMYRIRVVPLFLPPLRDRKEDIPALVRHFVAGFAVHGGRAMLRIAPDVRAALHGHEWPGNVRELRNVIEYAFAVGDGPVWTWDELPPELRGEAPPGGDEQPRDDRQVLTDALAAAGGRKSDAARLLGISRSTLWRRLREAGLSR